MDHLFTEISLLIIVASVLAIAAHTLKQPAILAYVATGVILGPWGLKLIQPTEFIHTLSSIGIALLLFLVGLELDLIKLRAIGKPSLILGLGQVLFTAGFGYLIIKLFGLSSLAALYVAIALTFSSTIIIVKLLSEQRAINSLHGRLAVGMLLVQDFLAIIALVLLNGFTNSPQANISYTTVLIIIKSIFLICLVWVTGRWLLPNLFNRLARSNELLFLASISWCLLFAGFATMIGFSLEIGSFLAGLALAPLPYNLEISSKLRSVRDFFIILFFILLGSQLVFNLNELSFIAVLILSLFVLIGNPIIVMILLGLMNYRKRTSFLVGLTVAQISEFSLILMSMGLRLGHVSTSEVSLVTLVGVITITTSTYYIIHGEKLYQWLSPLLNIFERPTQTAELVSPELNNHVVIFGYHRLGERIVSSLQKTNRPMIIVDFNPTAIKYLKQLGVDCLYGDMNDLELLEQTNIGKASLIISTNSDIYDNIVLLKNLKRRQIQTPIYLTADTWHDARDLYDAGADYVIFPHYLAGVQFSKELIESLNNKEILHINKTQHLAELEHRYNRVR